MGASHSKEERLYQEVRNGNHDAVKALHREGASLEWVDKEGKTPLIFACTRGELLDTVITLLNLGADINAYRAGAQGGFPLHHAAKKGLEKTATLLLSRGANPLAVNDDGHTPLDLARNKNQVSVVRILEERLCLFSGMLRELSGFRFLESFAPKFVTKKVWVVLLPTKLLSRGTSAYELAIYEPPKVSLWNGVHPSLAHPAGLCNVAQPQIKISLADAEIEMPNFNLVDPILYVIDKAHNKKYKFFSENKGNKPQLEKLYKACTSCLLNEAASGMNLSSDRVDEHPTSQQLGNSSQVHPLSSQLSPCRQPVQSSVSSLSSSAVSSSITLSTAAVKPIPEDDVALARALPKTILAAAEKGVSLSSTASDANKASHFKKNILRILHQSSKGSVAADIRNCLESPGKVSYRGLMTGHSISDSVAAQTAGQATAVLPSAPPLSEMAGCYPVDGDTAGICVVCWDARAEGACIPCGHLAGCMRCLAEVKSKNWNCPVCRGPLEKVIKVYAV